MIRRAVALLFFISSSTCFATSILPDSGQVTLKLNDNSIVSIKTCEEYISLRKAGKEIVDYPHLPDRFMQEAQNDLVQCYLKNYTEAHGYRSTGADSVNINIKDIVNHFPASASVIISNDEIRDIEAHYKGKTIIQRERDLKIVSDIRATSEDHADGYYLSRKMGFKDKEGKSIKYVTVVKYVIGGTWSAIYNYEILSTDSPIWQLTEITVNSPL